MNLWIRSQDKERLCKANNLFIKNLAICCSYNEENNDFDYLGIYKTKERALEVLDEIQDLITPKVRFKSLLSKSEFEKYKSEIIQLKTLIVYEMPKE